MLCLVWLFIFSKHVIGTLFDSSDICFFSQSLVHSCVVKLSVYIDIFFNGLLGRAFKVTKNDVYYNIVIAFRVIQDFDLCRLWDM